MEKIKQTANKKEEVSTTDGNFLGLPKKSGETTARMVTTRDDPEYKMNHRLRGLAVIFAHEEFDKLESRHETPIDVKNLEAVLTKLDFVPKIHKDLRYKDVKKEIKKLVKMDHTEHDCLLIVILTHGESDLIAARNKFYKLDDVMSAFAADKCTTLAGKPKLFVVETSPGELKDTGYSMAVKAQAQTDSDSSSDYKIPIFADFLVAFHNIPVFCSWSDSIQGSWFIKSLCNELTENGKSLDLLLLLTFVAQRVAVDFGTQDGHKQISCTMSTLTRNVRFSHQKQANF